MWKLWKTLYLGKVERKYDLTGYLNKCNNLSFEFIILLQTFYCSEYGSKKAVKVAKGVKLAIGWKEGEEDKKVEAERVETHKWEAD